MKDSDIIIGYDSYFLVYPNGAKMYSKCLPIGRAVWQNGVHSLVINRDDDRRHGRVADQPADAPLQPDLVLLFVDFALMFMRRVN